MTYTETLRGNLLGTVLVFFIYLFFLYIIPNFLLWLDWPAGFLNPLGDWNSMVASGVFCPLCFVSKMELIILDLQCKDYNCFKVFIKVYAIINNFFHCLWFGPCFFSAMRQMYVRVYLCHGIATSAINANCLQLPYGFLKGLSYLIIVFPGFLRSWESINVLMWIIPDQAFHL